MSGDNWDPVTERFISRDPQMPAFQNNKPVEPERGTVNAEVRAEKSFLDLPGRRYEPGCSEIIEKQTGPKIHG